MFIGFSFSENLGEFRIRVVGLYLRNISNENLGTSSMFALRGRSSNTHETDGCWTTRVRRRINFNSILSSCFYIQF